MGIEALVAGSIAAGLGGGAANYFGQRETNETNRQIARETNSLNRELWMLQSERDDNAVQRRRADLLAAGINPNLAAGSAAVSSAPPKMERAEVSNARPGDIFTGGLHGAQSAIAMETAMAQRDLTKANTNIEQNIRPEVMKAQTARDNATAAKALAEAGFKAQATRIVKKDADLWTKSNVDVRDRDIMSKVFKTVPGIKEKLLDQINNPATGGFNNPVLPPPYVPPRRR